jgi:hypothetical protein
MGGVVGVWTGEDGRKIREEPVLNRDCASYVAISKAKLKVRLGWRQGDAPAGRQNERRETNKTSGCFLYPHSYLATATETNGAEDAAALRLRFLSFFFFFEPLASVEAEVEATG